MSDGGDALDFTVRVGLSAVAVGGVVFPEGASTALGLAFLAAIWGIEFDGGGGG